MLLSSLGGKINRGLCKTTQICRHSPRNHRHATATMQNLSVSALASAVEVLSKTSPRLAHTRRLQQKDNPAGCLLQKPSLALLVCTTVVPRSHLAVLSTCLEFAACNRSGMGGDTNVEVQAPSRRIIVRCRSRPIRLYAKFELASLHPRLPLLPKALTIYISSMTHEVP